MRTVLVLSRPAYKRNCLKIAKKTQREDAFMVIKFSRLRQTYIGDSMNWLDDRVSISFPVPNSREICVCERCSSSGNLRLSQERPRWIVCCMSDISKTDESRTESWMSLWLSCYKRNVFMEGAKISVSPLKLRNWPPHARGRRPIRSENAGGCGCQIVAPVANSWFWFLTCVYIHHCAFPCLRSNWSIGPADHATNLLSMDFADLNSDAVELRIEPEPSAWDLRLNKLQESPKPHWRRIPQPPPGPAAQ
jgi:hypothetical protein